MIFIVKTGENSCKGSYQQAIQLSGKAAVTMSPLSNASL